jgi:hypothetical protein
MFSRLRRSLLAPLAGLCAAHAFTAPAHASDPAKPAVSIAPPESEMAAYLFVYFKDDTHGLYFALSSDSYTFTDVNGGRPVFRGEDIAEQKGIRDPYIMRGPDNVFYMAMTDLHIFAQKAGHRPTEWQRDGRAYGWGNNRALVLMKSRDLLNWDRASLRVDQAFPHLADIGCAWAPSLIHDPEANRVLMAFTLRFGNERNALYSAHLSADFTRFEDAPRALFDTYPGDKTCIDGDIVRVGNRYRLFYVPHDGTPGIKQAVSDRLREGYRYDARWLDPEPTACEAPNVWKRIGEQKWVLMYDTYGIAKHNFGFVETTDFETFKPIGRFNEGVMKTVDIESPKHGAVIHLTAAEARRLADHWKLARY